MNLLDMKTVILSYLISNAISTIVIFSLWRQNHRRFAGLGFWLADFAMQFTSLCLVILRGSVPDWVSMTVSNSLIIGGAILIYVGLEKFVGKRSTQVLNIVLLTAFISIHSYFVLVYPNLKARDILLSLGLLIICFQCAWLMLRKADPDVRPISHGTGVVFIGYCLASLVRIPIDLTTSFNNNFFNSGMYDTLMVMIYQMLSIILTISLFLMVNRRLLVDLESDIVMRKQAETALKLSEEKFFKAFHSSPDAVTITRMSDGRLVEVNEGFSRLTGYSREEALANSSINLGIWAIPQDREACIAALQENHSIRDREYDFRTKSGKILNGLYSGEIIQLGNEVHILSIVRDITDRRQSEEALRESEAIFSSFLENSPVYVFFKDKNIRTLRLSKNYEQMLGVPLSEAIGKTMDELFPSDLAKSMMEDDLRILNEGQRVDIVEELNGRIYETTKFPIYKDGKPDMLAGFTLDITERRRVEKVIQLRLRLNDFATTHSLNELIQKALDEIGLITGSPIGFYHFVEPDQKMLSLQAWSTRTLEEFCRAEGKGMQYNLDQAGVWVDCVRQRKPVIHNNFAALPHRKGMPVGHAEVIRELVVPTMRDGQIVSILGVGNKPFDYDEKDVELVSYIADVVWVIIDRKRAEEKINFLQAELREQAIRDPLTGLYNRRYLKETLERELARADRENYPVSFVMIDIDHFKNVNDEHGHGTGDTVLRSLAKLIMGRTRVGDIIYRYGGEEFLAILPNVTAESAFQVTERWRTSFMGLTLPLEYNSVKATVSCGISEYPTCGNTGNELIALADKAMYQAKARGRNCVVIWQAEHEE